MKTKHCAPEYLLSGALIVAALFLGCLLWPEEQFLAQADGLGKAVKITVFSGTGRQDIITGQPSVAKALAAAGIDAKGRTVFPDPAGKPADGMAVALLAAGERIVQETSAIPYDTVNVHDARREIGSATVTHAGENGQKSLLIKVSADHKKEILTERVVKEARSQVVALGTSNIIQASRGALRFTSVMDMEATAYTPWDEGCTGITKTGIPAGPGIAAVDPKVIKLGTRLYIPGYGQALAADIGGAITGSRIDLCMNSTKAAFAFGRRAVKVYILE